MIFSSPKFCKQEIQQLKQVFYEKIFYPKWVIKQVVEQEKTKHQTVTHSNNIPIGVLEQPSATSEEKINLLLLPYHGQVGHFALKLMRKRLKTLLPNNFSTQITFKDKKLSSSFKIKSKTQLILNISTILLIMGSVLLIIVTVSTLGVTGRTISEG